MIKQFLNNWSNEKYILKKRYLIINGEWKNKLEK